MLRSVLLTGAVLVFGGLGAAQAAERSCAAADEKALEKEALASYVAAINSNDTETLMADLTDDIVYQSPHAPEVVGKDAVREWVAGYYAAYETKWEKTSLDFHLGGDWAVERYAYRSTDTDRATGAVTKDVGKGINVYRRGADCKWRVAIDGWSTDLPVTE